MSAQSPIGQRVRLGDLPAEWRRVSAYRGILDITAVWLGVGAVVILAVRSSSPLAVVVALPLIGALQNHFCSLAHHAVHGNLHPNRPVNDWLARALVMGPLGMLLGASRSEHLAHHARFGASDDPERVYYDLSRHGRNTPAGLQRWLAQVLLTGWIVFPALRRLLTGDRDGRVAASPPNGTGGGYRERLFDAALVPFIQGGLALAFWGISGAWWSYVVLWLLPAVTLGGGLTVVRATLEHADVEQSPLLLSFVSNPVERFFISPFAFNYHYEHHRFMTVPYYHVAGIRAVLVANDDFGGQLVPSYLERLRQLLASLCAGALAG